MPEHQGSIWAVPCPAAPVGMHYYRRPVVAVDFLNDLRRTAQEVIDFYDATAPFMPGPSDYPIAKLRKALQ